MLTAPLLIELGVEELPPKSLRALQASFAHLISDALQVEGFINQTDALSFQAYGAPRRLAVLVHNVYSQQATQTVEKLGPNTEKAYDADGNPSKAAIGFAKSCNVDLANITTKVTDKGTRLYFCQEQTGQTLQAYINTLLQQTIKKLPIAKKMRWNNHDFEFVRPVHWLVVKHGENTLSAELFHLKAGTKSRGHRFHYPDDIDIPHANDYADILRKKGYVIADFNARRERILSQITKLASTVNGTIAQNDALVDEVTSMVEWPVALLGDFDTQFLSVPTECLTSSMRDHQKYFHLKDAQGQLLPHFITVSNIDSKAPERIIKGNERVLNARLSDAQFFWETDKKCNLHARLPALESILFHKKLGTLAQKSQRLAQSAGVIAHLLSADITICQRAGILCKADLTSDMVNEFDELQGIMGRYYAIHDKEPNAVAQCIEQHYWPKFSGDRLPTSKEADSLALAENLDNLTGIFAANEVPTGDKDPFALRRAALSVIRIIVEHQYKLSLRALIQNSAKTYQDTQELTITEDTQQQIHQFISSRLRAFYQQKKYDTALIQAVLFCGTDDLLDVDKRIQAIQQFSTSNASTDLAASNKRISSLLKKAQIQTTTTINSSLFTHSEETQLHNAFIDIEAQCLGLFKKTEYEQGLALLAKLRKPIDAFFENVMVMVEDEVLKQNRLALLAKIRHAFLQVADISLLSQK